MAPVQDGLVIWHYQLAVILERDCCQSGLQPSFHRSFTYV